MARPTLYTSELAAAICDIVATGATMERACARKGIGYRTVKEWKRKGRDGEEPFADFLEMLEIAEAEALSQLETSAHSKGLDDGYLAVKILERRAPETWQPRQIVRLEKDAEKNMTDEELQAIAATHGFVKKGEE